MHVVLFFRFICFIFVCFFSFSFVSFLFFSCSFSSIILRSQDSWALTSVIIFLRTIVFSFSVTHLHVISFSALRSSAIAHRFNLRVFSKLLKTERRVLAHVDSDTD